MAHQYNQRFLVAQIIDQGAKDPIVDWRTTASDSDPDMAVGRLRARLRLPDDQPLLFAMWALSDRVEDITAKTLARVVRPEYVERQECAGAESDGAEGVDRFRLMPYAG
jgi:hypothetical protein